jgi:polysaccharide biosynthesis/export protein
MGRMRTSVVCVVGEAEKPGAYTISSAATVMTALYRAGGPSRAGSFRAIQVRRAGRVVATLDLYDYLVRGDNSGDVRLEHGDVVFVPLAGIVVEARGALRRPAIFELRPGEDVATLLRYAGGVSADAALHRVQLDRVLTAAERRPGVDRVLLDVERGGEGVAVQNGDILEVFLGREERRHRVVLTGDVRRPGIYEWRDGMTLGGLIERAEDLDDTAYLNRIHVFRLDSRTGRRILLTGSATQRGLALADRDSVVVYSLAGLGAPARVSIDGFVKEPGDFDLAHGMTLHDLVLASGGFIPGAWMLEAEVARFATGAERRDAIAQIIRVPLGGQPTEDPLVPGWGAEAEGFVLEHGDRVFVRKAPGYESPRIVAVTGQVMMPGSYVLSGRDERVSDVIARAGGITSEGHAAGARITRGRHLVGLDLPAAMAQPGGRADIMLAAGDSVHVPEHDPTVLVRGAVGFESRVRYEPGKPLGYYIERAGGYTALADQGRVSVTAQNGERRIVRKRPLVGRNAPKVTAGATIDVPRFDGDRPAINWDAILTRVVGVASGLATVLIAVDRIQQ